MENLKRGYLFLLQTWRIARADPVLLKPPLYTLAFGMIATLIGLPFIVLAGMNLGERAFGQVITGFLGILLVFAWLGVGSVFSAVNIHLIHGYLTGEDASLTRGWQLVRRGWADYLSLAAAPTLAGLFRLAPQRSAPAPAAGISAAVEDTTWTEAAYLALPAMVVDELTLKDSTLRVQQIRGEHLQLMDVNHVGVRLANGLISFFLTASGILSGLGLGMGIASLAPGAPTPAAAGIAVGVLVAGFFIMTAVAVSTYTASFYYTCLYLWARSVEQARQLGHSSESVLAPAPLASAMLEPAPAV
jgi:hypothetical protein